MSECKTCGPVLSMSWNPIVRRDNTEDFEDLTGVEHDHSDGLWMTAFPSALVDGSDLSSRPFIVWYDEAVESGNAQIADNYLRFAANRGDWYAMLMLAQSRHEIEHDDESWRWASRIVFLLSNEANEFAEYFPGATREDAIQEAKDMMEVCIRNGASPDALEPNDVGVVAEEIYCLSHGILLARSASRETCDDSVHMASRSFS